jgi:ribonuclease VapC
MRDEDSAIEAVVADEAGLDASSVIAYIFRESGWEKTDAVLGNAFISTVNASEVISDLLNRNWALDFALKTLPGLNLNIMPHDFDQALKVAEVKKRLPRKAAISRADCACFALAETLGSPILTADEKWSTLGLNLTITQIR